MFSTTNLYQNDPQWKDVKLGNQNRETIGSWGCLLTSITMMLNGAGYQETPATVNEKLKSKGGFDGALLIPSMVPYVFPNVVYRSYEPCENRPAPLAQIDAALAAGKPVIVCVDWNPKEAGIQTHWVLLKERKGDNYSIYDPYRYRGDTPDKELLLTNRYKYQGTDPAQAISAVIYFDLIGQASKPPEKPKVPVPAERFIVYVAEDDLAFRAEPSPSAYLIRRLIAGTELISLEPKSAALAKIGQQGQWLQVQDPQGDQGYVAAWYLAATLTPPPSPQPSPAPAPVTIPKGALVVMPTMDDLALRKQPLVAPETLIKRLPITTQLIVTEPTAQAVPKIGVQNQWLKVKETAGTEGYVAAWYVQLASSAAPAPGVTPVPAPAPAPAGTIKVKTNTEEVAFRSQPIVAENTLIRRVPLNTEFTITEAGGESKIGVMNQWLKVKDAQGQEGYVAAWYVIR